MTGGFRLGLTGHLSTKHSVHTLVPNWQAPRFGYAKEWDFGGWFDPIAGPDGVTCPEGGVWEFTASAKFEGKNRKGRRLVAVRVVRDGQAGNWDTLQSLDADPNGTTTIQGSIRLRLEAGDRVQMGVEQQSGGDLLLAGSDPTDTSLEGAFVEPIPEGA